ncbi:MAG TPA: sigma-54 dependent transcriptional regulator [Xanthomonadales bacterium]|nr:sigma-54 dependent transcriptional regulator [Xanthomonadales bacterium]
MPHAQILVVDDEPDIRDLVCEILEDEGYSVSSARDGESARAAYATDHPDLVLLDIWMPDIDGITLLKEWSEGGALACPVVVMSGHGTLETAVEATRLGAHDFIQKPLSLAKLLATVKQALGAGGAADKPRRSKAPGLYVEPLGQSPQMQLLRQKAEQAARHESAVLVSGEAGSGRETIAAYIHKHSGRKGHLMVLDHCQLHNKDGRDYLFGKDAATGLFRAAADGTLYIPDIQLLKPEAQALLSLALESGSYPSANGEGQSELSCRILAGAPENLEQLVKRGTVTDQLYFQLNVLPLHVPALRERPEDVPELVRYYADWFPNQEDLPYRQFSISALNRLRNHSWPGNIRELRNLVQRLLILGGEGEVSIAEVEDALRQNAAGVTSSSTARPNSFDLPLREAREQFEREYLRYQLRKAGGSVGKLAESVGMERTHLYRKLRSLGIDPKSVGREGEAT